MVSVKGNILTFSFESSAISQIETAIKVGEYNRRNDLLFRSALLFIVFIH